MKSAPIAKRVKVAPASPKIDRRTDISLLARDMIIAGISAGTPIPTGEACRQFVRSARLVYDEVDNPTLPPKKQERDRDTGDGELAGVDDTGDLVDEMLRGRR